MRRGRSGGRRRHPWVARADRDLVTAPLELTQPRLQAPRFSGNMAGRSWRNRRCDLGSQVRQGEATSADVTRCRMENQQPHVAIFQPNPLQGLCPGNRRPWPTSPLTRRPPPTEEHPANAAQAAAMAEERDVGWELAVVLGFIPSVAWGTTQGTPLEACWAWI